MRHCLWSGPNPGNGLGGAGQQRIIPITDGTVTWYVKGRIVNPGANWHTISADTSAHLDRNCAFKTVDGALIEIINRSVRHGSPEVSARIAAGKHLNLNEHYRRLHARLETGDQRY
ncbi:MAG: DUF3237 family protein [Marinibacterium sp.]|nr:DUF3237 family protein [Marinibacterium sp.]